jgi:hypothetical protein
MYLVPENPQNGYPMAANELEAARELVHAFDLVGMLNGSDEELCLRVAQSEALGRALSAIQLAGAAEIAERSRQELGTAGLAQKNGCSKPSAFLEELTRISGAEASRRTHLGSALRAGTSLTGEPLPPKFRILAEAVAAGAVASEAATIIVRALDVVRRVATPDDLEVAESGLVRYAIENRVQ